MTTTRTGRCHDCGKPHSGTHTRCGDCRTRRRRPDRERRATEAADVFRPEVRAKLLDRLARGQQLGEACRALEVPTPRVHGYARYDEEWGRALDEALMAGRDPELPHGTPYAYRWGQCRCPDCRAVKRAGGEWGPLGE